METPRFTRETSPTAEDPLVEVENLEVAFRTSGTLGRRQQIVRAVDGVSFTIHVGKTLGLVGESGSGKSTTGRATLNIIRPTAGRVRFRGVDLSSVNGRTLRRMRREMQMVFQDPYGSLNPRMTVESALTEPLIIHNLVGRSERRERVRELLQVVGLEPQHADRYPHEFSGGQRQRIGIARALACRARFIVCDEPVSALDVSVQAQTINLMTKLQAQFNLSYLFIAHDLSIIRHVSDHVVVMYLGKFVESAPAGPLFEQPLHPYTTALMSAVPIPNPRRERKRKRILLADDVPTLEDRPAGCPFHPRCWLRRSLGNPARCEEEEPHLRAVGPRRYSACHFAEELPAALQSPDRAEPAYQAIG